MAERARPTRLQVFAHYLDPFSLRVLYALAFKYVNFELVEVDLNDKSQEFLEVNPKGQTPAIRYWVGDEVYTKSDSEEIVNWVADTYPGPPLYPLTLDMTEDASIRAQLAEQFEVIDTVASHYFVFIRGEPLDTQYAEMRDALRLLNDKYLAGGRPFAHELVGYENRVSVGDILLLPFVERLEANRGYIYGKEVLAQDLSNVWAWLQRMNTQGWYAQFKQLPRYFQKAVERSRVVGGHLTLPVTIYH